MPDHLDSLKDLMRLVRGWHKAALDGNQPDRAEIQERRLADLAATLEEVEKLRRITKPIPASYGDLSDLPAELIKELSGIKVDEVEQQLYTIINAGGDEVDLDAILIELFRRFDVVQTRKFLQNKLWRMAQKEIVFSVPGRKGVYSAKKPAVDEDDPFRSYGEATTANRFDSVPDDEIPF